MLFIKCAGKPQLQRNGETHPRLGERIRLGMKGAKSKSNIQLMSGFQLADGSALPTVDMSNFITNSFNGVAIANPSVTVAGTEN